MADQKLSIAVVGAGVAGITAAYLLHRDHRVSLFEKNDYLGGHTHTAVIADGPDTGTPIDTGFIVLNDRTYPLLNRFLARLNVDIAKSDMSFSVHCHRTGLQYASRNISTLFAQRRNGFNPWFWFMLFEILRFNRIVRWHMATDRLARQTLGAFLARHHFSRRFQQQYVIPMVAAIWSASGKDVARFPMVDFARFFNNHGLLTVTDQPQWYFVQGGSHRYVQAFEDRFEGDVYKNTAMRSIERHENHVILTTTDGIQRRFDRVVVATHADQALRLIVNPSPAELRLLSPWRYRPNEVYLHWDTRWMPSNPRAWASWNYIRKTDGDDDSPVTLTYHMNRLQKLRTHRPYFVTLNPSAPIAEEKVIGRFVYSHPVFTKASIDTQKDLPGLNGQQNTYYCGSYFKYGFHEDAVRAANGVATALGAGL